MFWILILMWNLGKSILIPRFELEDGYWTFLNLRKKIFQWEINTTTSICTQYVLYYNSKNCDFLNKLSIMYPWKELCGNTPD